ncbi:hypothetical protein RSal33209_2646 [Renibacterium salmoninarum ATCC 33209]|uniref:Uncharacterized protein n=1 Tax=Renibacterium salmoninarum (strain ATCC 33209 / DSM 20767 / JCM 11484 / NBRC 15589 / NCIMB 2235) TaxID=288705 RepID=A9WRT8_RENSM|nr:hypothetical protein RSal33209_2646 [Renibacterium salmoninarum ATCC 33209]
MTESHSVTLRVRAEIFVSEFCERALALGVGE